MHDNGSVPDAIQWHQGMLLAPQHFQEADRRTEALVAYHAGSLNPFHWGVRRLSIDRAELARGRLRIDELEAVMPDGLVVYHGPGAPADLVVDLAPAADDARPDRQDVMRVHLVVSRHGIPGRTVGEQGRFVSVEGPPLVDANTGEEPVEAPRLRPRASLLALPRDEAPPSRFVSLPLAELQAAEEGLVFTPFVAPLADLRAASALMKSCVDLVARIRERATYLADKLRLSARSGADGPDARAIAFVERVGAEVPVLETLLVTPAVGPFSAYLALVRLGAAFGSIEPGTPPPAFPPYLHEDPGSCFGEVLGFCARMLQRVRQVHRVVPFVQDDDVFRLRLRPEWITGDLVIGARRGAAVSDVQLEAWCQGAWIASASRLESIRERRIRGARRTRIESDPAIGVIADEETALFRVEADPEFVLEDEELIVAHPSGETAQTPPREIVLYLRAHE